MANTTNLNLVKPAGTDYALVSVINGNMDIIDSKVGAIPQNESVQSQITALNNQMIKAINDPVDVRNCSTMMELATLLRTKYTEGYTVGRAPCGSSQSNSFRDIVGSCPIGSYVTASVRLVLWSDETIEMEVVAVSQLSTVAQVAHKYLWMQGSGRVPAQSDWILTAQKT